MHVGAPAAMPNHVTIHVDGMAYTISVDYPGYLRDNSPSEEGANFMRNLITSIDLAKEFAAHSLVDTYNENWLDDEHSTYSVERFVESLTLKRIEILDTPECADLFFDDGGMFSGHVIVVSFSGTIPTHAQLLG
jgi:hypothetical protein